MGYLSILCSISGLEQGIARCRQPREPNVHRTASTCGELPQVDERNDLAHNFLGVQLQHDLEDDLFEMKKKLIVQCITDLSTAPERQVHLEDFDDLCKLWRETSDAKSGEKLQHELWQRLLQHAKLEESRKKALREEKVAVRKAIESHAGTVPGEDGVGDGDDAPGASRGMKGGSKFIFGVKFLQDDLNLIVQALHVMVLIVTSVLVLATSQTLSDTWHSFVVERWTHNMAFVLGVVGFSIVGSIAVISCLATFLAIARLVVTGGQGLEGTVLQPMVDCAAWIAGSLEAKWGPCALLGVMYILLPDQTQLACCIGLAYKFSKLGL